MPVILNIVKMSDVPDIVERLTEITQYRHSKNNVENKTFGEILNEELKKFEKEEKQKIEREGLEMIDIKDIAKEMTLSEFNKRFSKEVQGVKDNWTGKIHFCPNDLGFKLTRANCTNGFECKECWEYAEHHLESNQKIKEKLKVV